jgi:hypothetical protein
MSGSVPAAIPPHTPSKPLPFFAFEQALQVPAHATLQHTPSTQLPLKHCAGAAQPAPSTFSQAPVPSQLRLFAHSVSGSAPAAITPHTPSAPLPFFEFEHALQVPAHAVSQHTPSAQ